MSLNQTTIGSDNGLSPVQCQAILWTHADSLSLSNEPLATNLSDVFQNAVQNDGHFTTVVHVLNILYDTIIKKCTA